MANDENPYSDVNTTSVTSPSEADIVIYDGTDSWDNKAMSGDATISKEGVVTVADNSHSHNYSNISAAVIDEDDMASDSASHVPTQQSAKAYGDSGTQTMTNKTLTSPAINTGTLTSPVINTGVSGTAILDEDDMASDSATKLSTQQAIRAYVDNYTQKKDIHSTAASYVVTDTDGYHKILCDTSSNDVTITLPTAADNIDRELEIIVKTAGSGYEVIVDGEGAETINGAATQIIKSQYDRIKVVCDGTEWFILDIIATYDTGWVENLTDGGSTPDWTNVHLGDSGTADDNVTHSLGVNLSDLIVKILISTDGTDANSFEIQNVTYTYDSASPSDISDIYGISTYQVDTNNIKVQTGTSGLRHIEDAGTMIAINTEAWYYKIKVYRIK